MREGGWCVSWCIRARVCDAGVVCGRDGVCGSDRLRVRDGVRDRVVGVREMLVAH